MKRYKVVNKTRFCIFITLSFVLIFGLISLIFSKERAYSSVHEVKYFEVEVVEGDTLWTIVSRHITKGQYAEINLRYYKIQRNGQ